MTQAHEVTDRLAFVCQCCGGAFVIELHPQAQAWDIIARYCEQACEEPDASLIHRARAIMDVADPDELHDRHIAAQSEDRDTLMKSVNRIKCRLEMTEDAQEYHDGHHNVFRL